MKRASSSMDIAFPFEVRCRWIQFLAQFKDKILKRSLSQFCNRSWNSDQRLRTTTYAYAISRTTFKYRNSSRSSLFLVCCSTLVWYQAISWSLTPASTWWYRLGLDRSNAPLTIQHHLDAFLLQEDHSSHSRICSYWWCQWLDLLQIICIIFQVSTITLLTLLVSGTTGSNALLYIKSDNLYPLQYLLMQIQQI